MSQFFSADTADEAWLLAAEAFKSGESTSIQSSRDGITREILHAAFIIRDPRQRWILSRWPALNPAFAIAEVVWILGGRDDSRFVNHWNPILPRFAGEGKTYHGAYGHRLRRNLGVDQLERAFHALMHNPDSRQIVLQIWDARRDLPDLHGEPSAPDVPCNIVALLKLREGRLEWSQVIRSNDLVLGLPHNVIQFTLLQEVMAGWLGVSLGGYFQLSDSLHVYERDWQHVLSHSRRCLPKNSDSLMLPKKESDSAWAELERKMAVLVGSPELRLKDWEEVVSWAAAPESFRNLLRIVAADDARRRGWVDASMEVADECSNALLKTAWDLWAERCLERRAPVG